MMKTVSQTSAVAAAVQKVNGSAESILSAAISADKARGKLAVQVRELMASPCAVVSATLSAVFAQLEAKVTSKGQTDAEAWARIANSIATNVRIQWNGLPEDARPQVCYIALDRGALTANVQILEKPSKSELKAALGHDQKAYNAANERLFGKPAAKPQPKADSTAPKVVAPSDTNAPAGGLLAAIMEQTAPLSTGELHELVKRLEAEINARTAAALEKAEKKGAGVSATAKVGSKSRGESQKVAKNQPSKPSKAAAAPTAPTVEVQPTAEPSKTRRSSRKPEAAPTFRQSDAA